MAEDMCAARRPRACSSLPFQRNSVRPGTGSSCSPGPFDQAGIVDHRLRCPVARTEARAARVIRAELPWTAALVVGHVEVDDAIELLAGGDRLGASLRSRDDAAIKYRTSSGSLQRHGCGPSLVPDRYARRGVGSLESSRR